MQILSGSLPVIYYFIFFRVKIDKNRGGYNSTCVSGHVGPLCSSCDIYGDIKYTKDVGNVCSECINYAVNVIRTLLIGVALGVLLAVVIRFHFPFLKIIINI